MSAQVYPCFPPRTRGQPTVIKLDPSKKKLLYALDRTVVIRDVAPPEGGKPIDVQLYTGHGYPVTAVDMAPSGAYVASGDSSGCLRVWACDNPEQVLKLETTLFGGPILDIAWSADSQRIIGVGEGREFFGKVIMWDSGNSVGEIGGHAKKVNSCSFKTSRPFRVVTGSDDLKVNFYSGPPFKFTCTSKTHERFVNIVRFAPSGERFFSAASDMMLSVYDGKEGAMSAEKKVHTGSIMAGAWSADSTQILTASADGTAKVTDAATLDEVGSHSFLSGDNKKKVGEQQVGCCWAAAGILTYSLGGSLELRGSIADDAAALVQHGHCKPVDAVCMLGGKLYSGSFDDSTGTLKGSVLAWDLATGVASPMQGDNGHTNGVIGIGECAGCLVTCGKDDSVIFSTPPTYGEKVPIGAYPVGFACGANVVAVVTTAESLVLMSAKDRKVIKEVKLGFDPTCVAISSDDSTIAVGGKDNSVHVLDAEGKELRTLTKHREAVSAVAFAPGSCKLASGCANKEIVVWDAASGDVIAAGLQGYHTTRISKLAWSPDGESLGSGGVDAQIIVWDLASKKPKHKIPLAHSSGGINALAFDGAAAIISAGADACIKRWTL